MKASVIVPKLNNAAHANCRQNPDPNRFSDEDFQRYALAWLDFVNTWLEDYEASYSPESGELYFTVESCYDWNEVVDHMLESANQRFEYWH